MDETKQGYDENFIEKLEQENLDTIDGDLEHVKQEVNRYYEELTISKITGPCPYDHKEGDNFKLTCMCSDSLCGSMYQEIHPALTTLHYGGGLPWGDDPLSFKGTCPEGKVHVKGRRIEQPKPCFVRTKTKTIDMTGKGFPGVDEYRINLEVISVANKCEWGHCEGKKNELDIFNIGEVCGFMYWEIYHFINLLISGGSLAWEADPNIIHGVCPDAFNQVTYRLIREKR